MIPLRDNVRSGSFPFVNIAIIVACVAMFLMQMAAGGGGDWAFRPAMLRLGGGTPLTGAIQAMFLSMFMHGSILHIGFNMLFLWVFGDNVEDRMGHLRYLIFYLGAGVVATVANSVVSGFADVPMVGASGAIAGVLGAYLVLLPQARIRTLVFLLFFITIVELPAPLFLIYWFAIQLFQGVGSIGLHTGVAYGAHVGGFAVGFLFARLIARPRRRPPPPSDYERGYYGPPRTPPPPRITRMRIE